MENESLDNEEILVHLRQLKQSNKDILDLLRGRSMVPGEKGLLGDVTDLKAKMTAIENQKTRAVGWVAGVFFAGSMFASIVLWLLNNFLKK